MILAKVDYISITYMNKTRIKRPPLGKNNYKHDLKFYVLNHISLSNGTGTVMCMKLCITGETLGSTCMSFDYSLNAL